MSDEENKPAESQERRKHPLFRLVAAMFIGLLVLEVMLEVGPGITLWGGKNGIFISHVENALYQAEIVDTPLSETAQVLLSTDIREQPALFANKVGKIERGTELRLVGMTTVNEEVWYRVQRFGGKIGYIPGNSVFRK